MNRNAAYSSPGRRRDDPRPGAAGPAGPCVRWTDRAVRLTEDEGREEDAEMRHAPVFAPALTRIARALGVDVGKIDPGTARAGPLVRPGRRPVGDGRTGDASGRVGSGMGQRTRSLSRSSTKLVQTAQPSG
jgi:hypothetical protein